MSELIEEIIRGKKLEYPNKKINMLFSKHSDNEFISVKAIPSELRLAISNIVNNSFQALEEGKIIFDLSLKGNLAIICISDNGPGISSNRIREIVKGKSYKRYGNGIPQSIKIIESFDGEIVIDSKKSLGMKTTISLLTEGVSKERYTQEQIEKFQCILIEDSKVRRVNFEVKHLLTGILDNFNKVSA